MPAAGGQPWARAFALHVLAVAAATLALLAIVLSAIAAEEGECIIHGHANVTHFHSIKNERFQSDEGLIWLLDSKTVQVQGWMGGYAFLKEITVGGPLLHGGVLHIMKNETAWYPPSGGEQAIHAEENSVWSAPGIDEISVTHPGDDPMHTVHVKVGDFELAVERASGYLGISSSDHKYLNLKLSRPVHVSDTGLCVDAIASTVPDADNLLTHNSSSPSVDTMEDNSSSPSVDAMEEAVQEAAGGGSGNVSDAGGVASVASTG